jgi:hypothetical protein
VHDALEQRDLAVVLMERGAQDGAHVVLVERFRRSRQDPAEVLGMHDRDRDPDEAGLASGEGACAAVRREVVAADGAQHGVARRGADVGAAVEHAGDCCDRDACVACDVADRCPSAPSVRFCVHALLFP